MSVITRIAGGCVRRAGRSAEGFTLIEVLVALVIFSVGLLGMAALHATAIRLNGESFYRTQASVLAHDLVDRMRANRTEALGSNAYLNAFGDVAADFTPCLVCGSAAAVANNDLNEWKSALSATLPAGTGSVSVVAAGANPVYAIRVRWDEDRGIGPVKEFVLRSEI